MVNDCAFVGETLIKYFPPSVQTKYLKRSRGFFSKTFAIAWKIYEAKSDIFHVHYLLQDCYLASKLGKRPLLGHAHGTDLRLTLKHPLFGRLVRHNLKNCDKVLVSTPDLLRYANRFTEHAVYLPNPIDIEYFYPKQLVPREGRLKILIGSCADWRKGTGEALC